MTREQIEAKLKAAKDNREQLIAQINATNGYIQAYEEMLEAQLTTPVNVSQDRYAGVGIPITESDGG